MCKYCHHSCVIMQPQSEHFSYHKPWPEKLTHDDGCAERVAVSFSETPGGMAGGFGWWLVDGFTPHQGQEVGKWVWEGRSRNSSWSLECGSLEDGGAAEPQARPQPRPLGEGEVIGISAAQVAARSNHLIRPTPAPHPRPWPLPQPLPCV